MPTAVTIKTLDGSNTEHHIDWINYKNQVKLRPMTPEEQSAYANKSQGQLAEMDMSSPEFQQALMNLKKKAALGPRQTEFNPKTKKYRTVPVHKSTNDKISESVMPARGDSINFTHNGKNITAVILNIKRNIATVRHPLAGKITVDLSKTKYDIIADESKQQVSEQSTYEDILSKLKTRLGDYLGDVAQAVKDTDLSDKPTPATNTVNAVKTIMTDDGHEIRIHGNEDDGFRITIKNKDASAKFASLSEAEIAANLYCAKRRQTPVLQAADYVSEENKDACYHKVKSRYKVWPSAYASGALVQCRKKGAKNWGNK
jgi:hypothetical protein